MRLFEKGHSLKYGTGLLLALLPAAVFFTVLAVYGVNIPRGDDYISILPFLCDWIGSSSLASKGFLLWEQFFSHRILLTKILALAQFALMGECHFLVLQCLGWAGWLALSCWLAFSPSWVRKEPLFALPVFLLLMQPQGYTNFHTAMQSIQNIGVVFLAFAVLSGSLSSKRVYWLSSLFLSPLAAFTSANGLLVYPAAILLLWIRKLPSRASAYAFMGALTWLAFFAGYKPSLSAFNMTDFALNTAAMAGGFLDSIRMPLVVVLVSGLLLLLLSLFCLAQARSWRNLPVHGGFMCFLLLSIAMAAFARMGWGHAYMLQDRYRLYGMLLAACLLLLLGARLDPRQRRIWMGAGTTLALLFSFFSYAGYLASLKSASRWCEATALNHSLGQSFLLASGENWDASQKALNRAEQMNVYRLPEWLDPRDLAFVQELPPEVEAEENRFQAHPNKSVLGYLLDPCDIQPGLAVPDFAVVRTGAQSLILPVFFLRTPLSRIPESLSLTSDSFSFVWPKNSYVPGQHPVYGLIRNPEGRLKIAWTGVVDCPQPLLDVKGPALNKKTSLD
jgi:hypothetical protein